MDALSYDYTANGNQLNYVTDASGNTGGFEDGNTNGNDYTYDANGNMITDANKAISSIQYNSLNLPEEVVFANGDRIRYFYDAAGIKLRKEVYKNGVLDTHTDYMGALVMENNDLQFVQTAEGRVVPKIVGGESTLEYQYHLKDHLGNVRTTFAAREDQYQTSFEDSSNPFFDNYDQLNLITNGQQRTGSQVHVLNGADQANIIGLMKTLSVSKGDVVNAGVYGKYLAASGQDEQFNPTALIGALVNVFTSGGATVPLEGSSLENGMTGTDYLSAAAVDNGDDNGPKAYLNYILLDKQMNYVEAGFDRLSSAASDPGDGSGSHEYLRLDNIEIPQDGYLLVFLSNESQNYTEVYWDDFSVTHDYNAVVQKDDYYPFGLTFNEYQRKGFRENNFLYNGKELQDDFDVNWMDYGARMQDPALGRFLQVDPAANMMRRHSPYNYAFDNPIRFIDPDGMVAFDVVINGDMAEEATAQLNASSDLDITRDSETGRLSATGKATTKSDKALLAAINDENVTVNVNATSSNRTNVSGSEKDLLLGAFGGSTTNADGTVTAQTDVNPNQAEVYADVYQTEAGAVVTHEILESYSAAVETPGTKPPTMEDVANKTENGKNYLKAHKTAIKQDPRYIDPTIIGDNSSGTGIYYLQQMRNIPGLANPFPFEKELFKKKR